MFRKKRQKPENPYRVRLSAMHKEIYGTEGSGTFGEKLDRVLKNRTPSEVFDDDNDRALPLDALTHIYSLLDDDSEKLYTTYFTTLANRDGDQILQCLDVFVARNYIVPLEKYLYLLDDDAERKARHNFHRFESLMAHEYWDHRRDALIEILGNLSDSPVITSVLRERVGFTAPKLADKPPELFTVERIAALVTRCQQEGSLAPLQKALKGPERQSDLMTGNVLNDVNSAYRQLKGTFWEARELVNALQPGTYAYPVQKAIEPPRFSLGWLKQNFAEMVGTKSAPESRKDVAVNLDPHTQYKASMAKIGRNIDGLNQAVESLYRVNRKGCEYMAVMESFVSSIAGYLETEEGKSLQAKDSMLYEVLTTSQVRLRRSSMQLDAVSAASEHIGSRIIPMSETLSSVMNSMNVVMIVQTEKSVMDFEGYRNNFHGVVVNLADLCKTITTEFSATATILQDTSATKAATLIADAREFHASVRDWGVRLKASGDPTTPLVLAENRSFDGGPG